MIPPTKGDEGCAADETQGGEERSTIHAGKSLSGIPTGLDYSLECKQNKVRTRRRVYERSDGELAIHRNTKGTKKAKGTNRQVPVGKEHRQRPRLDWISPERGSTGSCVSCLSCFNGHADTPGHWPRPGR
jgi:hypothetical protein